MGNQCSGLEQVEAPNMHERVLQSDVIHTSGFQNGKRQLLKQKIYHPTSRLAQIYHSQKEDNNKDQYSLTQVEEVELVIAIKPYNPLDSHDSISVDVKIRVCDFSYKSDYDFIIQEHPPQDINNYENPWFRCTKKNGGEKYTMKAVNFDDYEDNNFKELLQEIYIVQQLQKVDNVVKIIDYFILKTDERQSNTQTLIVLYSNCDQTLQDIIEFRKKHNYKWTHDQINTITKQLLNTLVSLEQQGIAHRDIRPHNIWWDQSKQSFVLAGFQDAKIIKKPQIDKIQINSSFQTEDLIHTVRGVPDFMPPELQKLGDSDSVGKYSPFASDVYSMGITLTMIKCLDINLDNSNISQFINNAKSGKPDRISPQTHAQFAYKQIIQRMLLADEKIRITHAEIAIAVNHLQGQFAPVNEEHIIKSMAFKQAHSVEEANRLYAQIAQQYYKIFDWEKWNEKMNEILLNHEQNNDLQSQAELNQQIGNGYLEINNLSKAKDFLFKAATFYNEEGNDQRKKNEYSQAFNNFVLALDCVRKSNNGEETYEQAMVLENIGNILRLQGQFARARCYLEEAFNIIVTDKGEEDQETARVLVSLGKVYSQLGDYKRAYKRIKAALKIMDQILHANSASPGDQSDKAAKILRCKILTALGEVQRQKGRLKKAKKNLEEALKIREPLQGSGNVEVASNIESLGNVYFDMQNYHEAQKMYERSLVLKKNKVGETSLEVALTYNNIGNASKHLGEFDKAAKFYFDSLQILTKVNKGDDHPQTAMVLTNIGLLYKDQGKIEESKKYLDQAQRISSKTMDQNHPDAQFIQASA